MWVIGLIQSSVETSRGNNIRKNKEKNLLRKKKFFLSHIPKQKYLKVMASSMVRSLEQEAKTSFSQSGIKTYCKPSKTCKKSDSTSRIKVTFLPSSIKTGGIKKAGQGKKYV